MHIQRHSQLLRHRRERTTPAPPAHPLGSPYPSLREKEKTRLAMCWCAGGWMDGDGPGGEREREREIRGNRGVWRRRRWCRRREREGCSRDLLRISASPFVHDISEDNPVIFSTRKLDKLLGKGKESSLRILRLKRRREKKKKKKTRVPRFILDLVRGKDISRLSIFPPTPSFLLTLIPPLFLP